MRSYVAHHKLAIEQLDNSSVQLSVWLELNGL